MLLRRAAIAALLAGVRAQFAELAQMRTNSWFLPSGVVGRLGAIFSAAIEARQLGHSPSAFCTSSRRARPARLGVVVERRAQVRRSLRGSASSSPR
jgi:hypothetical protein